MGRAVDDDVLHQLHVRDLQTCGVVRRHVSVERRSYSRGIEIRAVSYTKGCYIGQEVLARIRTYGQVAKTLRRLRLADGLPQLPAPGDKLFHGDKEAGYITSAVASPAFKCHIALGYVRREYNQAGTELTLHSAGQWISLRILSTAMLKK